MGLIEQLEHRTLLATTPVMSLTSKGTLFVQGTSRIDDINVGLLGNKPEKGFRVLVISGGKTYDFRAKFKKVKRIYVDAGGGGDSIFVGGGTRQTKPAQLLGGAGNDTINYSAVGSMLISGGSGDDVVGATAIISVTSSKNRDVMNKLFAATNSTGVNTILGSAGNDTLSGDTNDIVDGGSGTDLGVLTVAAGTTNVNAARRAGLAEIYFQRLGAASIEQTTGFSLI